MTELHLVRHGKAGRRDQWDGPDDLRPLSNTGQRQAAAIKKMLKDAPIERIVSSPSLRCRQTVEPLAEKHGLPVELDDVLAEGTPRDEAVRLVDKFVDSNAVLCTHGDVLTELLDHFAAQGVQLRPKVPEKGSVVTLRFDNGTVVDARYLALRRG